MIFLITESQVDKLKKSVFKYWDMNGGSLDLVTKFLGIKFGGLDVGGNTIFPHNIAEWLIEWNGMDNIKKIMDEIFTNDYRPHKIDNCGSYIFEFEVFDYQIREAEEDVLLGLKINVSQGSVDLMWMEEGEGNTNLGDAIEMTDIGWEVQSEVKECIYDYFGDKIRDKTGFDVVIEDVDYV